MGFADPQNQRLQTPEPLTPTTPPTIPPTPPDKPGEAPVKEPPPRQPPDILSTDAIGTEATHDPAELERGATARKSS
jgi:hypothetical protein